MAEDTASTDSVELATELTIAWLANPNTKASSEDVPAFLQNMHQAVINLTTAPAEQPAEPEYIPAVTVRRSLSSKDHIISLIDGKPYKTLRRHLSGHGLTPEQYRQRYNLKSDYPMVSASYSEVRRDMAKRIGLGRKPAAKVAAAPAKAPAPDAVTPKAAALKAAAEKPAATPKPTAAKPASKKPAAAKPAAAKPVSKKSASPKASASKPAGPNAAAPATATPVTSPPAKRGRKPKAP
ncbi:hypothetical protein GKE62_06420 [Novosphingobium sp. Gsoil 351]|nr:hypothetical protein GKE62_06420 [Novosphingobium sp. Gsoil 351]